MPLGVQGSRGGAALFLAAIEYPISYTKKNILFCLRLTTELQPIQAKLPPAYMIHICLTSRLDYHNAPQPEMKTLTQKIVPTGLNAET